MTRRMIFFMQETLVGLSAGGLGNCWRRWTGIEPAGRGSPVPPALKAGEPTRCPDTSGRDPRRKDQWLKVGQNGENALQVLQTRGAQAGEVQARKRAGE